MSPAAKFSQISSLKISQFFEDGIAPIEVLKWGHFSRNGAADLSSQLSMGTSYYKLILVRLQAHQ
jgi:hypothetical protein